MAGHSSTRAGRAAFMTRVSAALGRARSVAPTAVAPAVHDATTRVAWAGADLVAMFADRATKAGMSVHRCSAGSQNELLGTLLGRLGARRVAIATSGAVDGVGLAAIASGLELVEWRHAGTLQPLYAVDAGITDVQAAIAETGTLVCCSGAGRGRGLSLVPPLHIAVVRRSDIVPDLIDYLARHAGAASELPSSIVFITGPSKTADIEGVLITGVHGPREVHIVVVEDA